MINNKYSDLMEKIRLAGHFVSELTNIEHSMNVELENDNIDIAVVNILSKCINDINNLYINANPVAMITSQQKNIDFLSDEADEKDEKIKELEEEIKELKVYPLIVQSLKTDKEVLEDKLEVQEDELIKAENELQQIKTDYNIEDK